MSPHHRATPSRHLSWLPERFHGVPLVAVSCVFFALMAVFARMLAGQLSAGQVVLIRFLVGLGFVAATFKVTGTRPKFSRPGMWALRGILGGLAVYLYFLAIEHLEVGPATLLNYTSPVFAALFAAVFIRERLTANIVTGLLVATFGAAIVIWSTVDPAHPLQLGIGVWAGIASSVCSGAAMTVIRSLRRDTDALTVFFSFCLFGAVIAAPLAALDWMPLTGWALWLGLLVGLSSAVAQMLFTYAFGFTSAASGSAGTQLTPAFSWAMGVIWLDEKTSVLALVGATICVAGVILGATGPWSRRPQRGTPEGLATAGGR
jgi:drug/metabolite transporter (DMT)-like permease